MNRFRTTSYSCKSLLASTYFLLFLIVIIGVLNIVYTPTRNILFQEVSNKVDCVFPKPEVKEKFVFFRFFAVNAGGRLGNIVFEHIVAHGIARRLNRTFVLNGTIGYVRSRIINYLGEILPNMMDNVVVKFMKTDNYIGSPYIGCCKYSNQTDRLVNNEDSFFQIPIHYHQSYKYFQNFERKEVLHLLSPRKSDEDIARKELVKMEDGTHNICVHTRRGDYLKSRIHLESKEDFTELATKLVVEEVRKRDKTNVRVIILGADNFWNGELFKNVSIDFPVTVANTNKKWVAHIDWIFSMMYCDIVNIAKMYCDTVLITASCSSYGWWLSYMSRGQDIYYNKDFSKPNGIEKELEPKDFFPPHWKPIAINRTEMTVKLV